MDEGMVIIQGLKAYGIPGAIISAVVMGIGALAKRHFFKGDNKAQQENNAISMALNVLQNQLQVNQDNNTRLFDILDRNTRSVEKMVEKMTEHGHELGVLKDQLSRIEGAVGR